jgi:type VI secretion system secreted protein VgrG
MALLGRDTSVRGPFPTGVLLLETLRGQEALGRPYRFELGLLSKEPNLDPDDLLGQPLAVGIQLNTGKERFFHGIVTGFHKGGATQLHTRYAVELRPVLSLFDHTFDCRVFNDPAQDALSIVKSVLAKRGLGDVESGSIQDHVYRAREFCVQYRESDLNFVQRLLEEEGIYYFFKHEESKHTLVLADSITGHETADGCESILYTAKERRVAGSEEHFWGMKVRRGLYPGRHTVLSGYDPTALRPRQPQFGRGTSEDLVTGYPFEHYDYPGGLFAPEEAQQEATVRSQVRRVDHTIIEVEGNTMGLGLGNLVTLRPGPDGADGEPFWGEEDFGKQYLVVGASYRLSVDQYETGDVAFSDEPFKATYQLLDSHTQFRPARVTRKPHMPGRLDRQARARDGAVRLGSAGRAQREVVVLDPRVAAVVGGQVRCAIPAARRAGSDRGVPRRGSRPAHHHGQPVQQKQHAAVRFAGQSNPKRHQKPQQQGRHGQQLQRAALRR